MLGRFCKVLGSQNESQNRFSGSFFRCFIRMRFGMDFGSFFGGSEPCKYAWRLGGSTGARFLQNRRFHKELNKSRFWAHFRKSTLRKIVETCEEGLAGDGQTGKLRILPGRPGLAVRRFGGLAVWRIGGLDWRFGGLVV